MTSDERGVLRLALFVAGIALLEVVLQFLLA